MNKALPLLCITAAGVICAVVMLLNASFWASIGHDLRTQLAFAIAAVAVDTLKVALLPLAALVLARGLRTCAVTAVSLWVLLTAFSLYSAWSFAQLNAGRGTAELIRLRDDRKAKEKELQRLAEVRGEVPRHRNADLLETDRQELTTDPNFRSTRQCMRPNPAAANVCDRYHRLVAEQAAAKLASRLDQQLQGLSAEIRGLNADINRLTMGNPAIAIESTFGWEPGQGFALINGFIIAVLELASGVGMYLGLRLRMETSEQTRDPEPPTHWEPVPPRPEPKNAARKEITRRKNRAGDHDNGARP